MKCQNCGVRDANVRYSQNINGRKAEVCLCSGCANELGILNNLSSGFDFGFEKFNNMFSNFFDDFAGIRLMQMPKIFLDVGTEPSIEENDCYDRTNPELYEALKNITKKTKNMTEKEKLEKELKDCIDKENYERAAEIRDKLKNM